MTIKQHLRENRDPEGDKRAENQAREIYNIIREGTDDADYITTLLTHMLIRSLGDTKEGEGRVDAAVCVFMNLINFVNPACCHDRTHQLFNAIEVVCTIFSKDEARDVLVALANQAMGEAPSRRRN